MSDPSKYTVNTIILSHSHQDVGNTSNEGLCDNININYNEKTPILHTVGTNVDIGLRFNVNCTVGSKILLTKNPNTSTKVFMWDNYVKNNKLEQYIIDKNVIKQWLSDNCICIFTAIFVFILSILTLFILLKIL